MSAKLFAWILNLHDIELKFLPIMFLFEMVVFGFKKDQQYGSKMELFYIRQPQIEISKNDQV